MSVQTQESTSRVVPTESFDVIVIGAGQTGLSAAWYLRQKGMRFVVLEGAARVGDQWRRRWDSLRLFTQARYDGLVGMPFPAHPDSFPTKDEMADYLEAYVRKFDLPVRTGMRVERVSREGTTYRVEAGGRHFTADHVVVATASYQRPRLPEFSADLPADIVQLHSSEYKNPSQLRPGGVLIVGAGNSGAEIAKELVEDHEVWMSGRDVGAVPVRIDTFFALRILTPIVFRIVSHRIMSVYTPMGRKARPTVIAHGGPLVRVKPWDLDAMGVHRVGRTAGTSDGRPVLDDGRVLDVTNVIWCTGFRPQLGFLDLPGFEDGHEPEQDLGVARNEPGLYFMGLHFQVAMSSTMIHGAERDARLVVGAIEKRLARR